MSELDALDPVPEQLKLSSGTFVLIEDLKARQFFKLLRIVTHGALPNMRDLSIFQLDPDTSQDEFGARLLSVMVMSIPDAENETLEFVQSMCKPVGLIEGRRQLSKQDLERNADLWTKLLTDLDNPELDDLVTIIEAVVRREAADIQALGKRLAAMFKLAQKTGQVPSSLSPTSQTQTSSAASVELSDFSPVSTDGPMTSSETSPSDGSDSASLRSVSDATMPVGSATSG